MSKKDIIVALLYIVSNTTDDRLKFDVLRLIAVLENYVTA
jgi:hypothetical protein